MTVCAKPNQIASRRRLEQRIEEMILLLDQIDGDPDLEDGGDREPLLTATDGDHFLASREICVKRPRRCRIDTSDREDESERDEDGCDQEDDQSDREPSLGWTHHEVHHRDGQYAAGWDANQDLELDDSDYEPETDLGIDDMPHDEENVL